MEEKGDYWLVVENFCKMRYNQKQVNSKNL